MRNEKGFTLIELMVVVTVVGLALAIILVFGPPVLRAYKWNDFARTTQSAFTHARMRAMMQGGKLDASATSPDPYRIIARDVRLRFVAVDRGVIPRGDPNDPIPFGEYYFNDGTSPQHPLRSVEELRFLYESVRAGTVQKQIILKKPNCSPQGLNEPLNVETTSGLSADGEVTFSARGYEKNFLGCRVYLRNPKRGQCYRYVILPMGRIKEEEQTSPYDFGAALPPCSCP